MRERLPDRREGEALEVNHLWNVGTSQEVVEPLLVTFGRYPDGRVGEVFIDSLAASRGKLAARTHDLQKDVAVLISIALQHGAGIEELRDALGRGEVSRMGKVMMMPATIAGSVLDALASEPSVIACLSEASP